MARKLRVQPTGVCYHVVTRIAHREFMFDETERDIVVGLIGRTAEFSGVTVVAYCVMSNHLHLFLFIEKPESLQLFERWANIVGVDLERARDGASYRLQDGTILCEDEAEEVRSCVAMSLFDRYEMTFDELKRRMQLLMRPSAYQELMDKWSSMPKADLDLECARFLRRMYDLSGFMKTLKQDISQYYNIRHGHTGALWEGRFRDSYVERSLDPMTSVSTYIDLNPWRAGMCAHPAEYRWCSFGAAVGGSEFARSGYRFMYGNADDWSTIESIHREQIQHRMDKAQSGQEEVEDALFTSGGIIGSSAFVEELTRRERVAFPRERKSSPQEVCVGGLKLFALRHLKAFRK